MSNISKAIEKQRIYQQKGFICQTQPCSNQYISLFNYEMCEIELFDPQRQQIIEIFSLPQRIITKEPLTNHFVTNDLKYLFLIWKDLKYSDVFQINSPLAVERLKGEVLGYFKDKVTQIYKRKPILKYSHYKTIVQVNDALSKYPTKRLYFVQSQVQFSCFKKHFLLSNEQLSKIIFFNIKHKATQVKFRLTLSLSPLINFSHNINYFLFGFDGPCCMLFIVKQANRFKQIRRITVKAEKYSIIEAGKCLFYQDKNSNFIYQMNMLNFSLTCITRGFSKTQIQCTLNRKYLVCTKKNHLVTFDLSL